MLGVWADEYGKTLCAEDAERAQNTQKQYKRNSKEIQKTLGIFSAPFACAMRSLRQFPYLLNPSLGLHGLERYFVIGLAKSHIAHFFAVGYSIQGGV